MIKKVLNVYFWNKNEKKVFQIDLSSEEQVLEYTVWTGNASILNMPESAEICQNVGKYSSISVTLWICLKRETLRV